MSPRVRHRPSRIWSICKHLFDSTELDERVNAMSLKRFDKLRLVYVAPVSQAGIVWIQTCKANSGNKRSCLINEGGNYRQLSEFLNCSLCFGYENLVPQNLPIK